jgi:hypothetical protein
MCVFSGLSEVKTRGGGARHRLIIVHTGALLIAILPIPIFVAPPGA